MVQPVQRDPNEDLREIAAGLMDGPTCDVQRAAELGIGHGRDRYGPRTDRDIAAIVRRDLCKTSP